MYKKTIVFDDNNELTLSETEKAKLYDAFITGLKNDTIYTKKIVNNKLIITSCNPAYIKKTLEGKYTANKIYGKTDRELGFPEADCVLYEQHEYEVINTKQPITKIYPLRDCEGKTIAWEKTTKIPLFDSAGNVSDILGISTDITNQIQNEADLKMALALASTGIITIENHIIKTINNKSLLLLGYETESDLKGKSIDIIFAEEKDVGFYEGSDTKKDFNLIPFIKKDNTTISLAVKTTQSGTLIGLSIVDPTDNLNDVLTGLPNRKLFDATLPRSIYNALRNNKSIAIVSLDFNNLKIINDNHGHPVGDKAIQEFVKTIANNLRPSDYFARTGGDEFFIILENINHPNLIQKLERFRISIEETRNQINLPIAVSMGATVFSIENKKHLPIEQVTIEEVARIITEIKVESDLLMYKAKNTAGKTMYEKNLSFKPSNYMTAELGSPDNIIAEYIKN